MDFAQVSHSAALAGLVCRGAFHPAAGDGVPAFPGGIPPGTLILLGFAGNMGWPAFAASAEAQDGGPDPLDRWSRRVIGRLAGEVGGAALFPFGGPPFLPFQRWARRAEPVHPSPLGLLIHPQWGLWHSYRGAVVLREQIALPPRAETPSPCDSCAARPCLTACPVDAFAADGYDAGRCVAHLTAASGAACMSGGCLARLACPIGSAHRHQPDQAAFTMRSFRAAHRREGRVDSEAAGKESGAT